MKISNTAINKYMTCPMSYKYHYVDKLRGETSTSALFFGRAIDKTTELMIKDPSADYKQFFIDMWTYPEIDGQKVYMPELTENIVYYSSDLDDDLFTDEERKELTEAGWTKSLVFTNEAEKKLVYKANWISLKHKGLAMLEAFKTKVMPLFKKVHGTQVKIDLTNNENDTVDGYADFVADVEGYNKPIIFDNKTASAPYKSSSVKTSKQLSTYLHALSDQYDNTRYAGYIVFLKEMNKTKSKVCTKCGVDNSGKNHKTCPELDANGDRCNGSFTISLTYECDVQIIIDEISENVENITIENYDAVVKCIKNKVYYRNFNACDNQYGKPCIYYMKCHSNNEEGLVCKSRS